LALDYFFTINSTKKSEAFSIPALKKLKTLSIKGPSCLKKQNMRNISNNLPSLTSLNLGLFLFFILSFSSFFSLVGQHSLNFKEHVAALNAMTQLRVLQCTQCLMEPMLLGHVASMSHLRMLVLSEGDASQGEIRDAKSVSQCFIAVKQRKK
jgi:hypothetical protein